METKDILKKVDMLNIDSRLSLIVGSYFCAKVKLGDITEETIDNEIQKFKEKVKHFEFVKSSNFNIAYEKAGGILTLSEDAINKTNIEDMVPLIFMKIEEGLNLETSKYADGKSLLHIKSFQKAIQLVQELNLPYNNNYNHIYNILTHTFGNDGKALDEEISKDRGVESMCNDTDEQFNKMIAQGQINSKVISEIINFYRYKVLIEKENGIDVTSEKYKKSLERVLKHVYNLSHSNYANMEGCRRSFEKLAEMVQSPIEVINENYGISINEYNNSQYNNFKLLAGIEERITNEPEELTPEYIKSRVSELIDQKPEYDRRLSCLLPEFFLRSATVFGWNTDDFEQRINTIDSTVEKIQFKELDNYSAGDTAIDEIKINSKFYLNNNGRINTSKNSLLELARTFFHEAGHNTDKSVREGIVVKEKLAKAHINNIFYEWSNTVFERAIMGDMYEDKSAIFLNQNAGYERIANIGSIISAALGMSEIEFAKLKDAGLEQTIKFFDENFSYYPGLYEKLKTTFMTSSVIGEGKEARKNLQQMYRNVYDLCLEVLDARIENDMQTGNIEELNEYQTRQQYLLKKMNLNYQVATKKYGLKREAKKVVHQTKYITDKISKKDMREIGASIIAQSDFGFKNEELIENLKYSDRKPKLSLLLKKQFGRVPLLEAGREEIKYTEREDSKTIESTEIEK